MKRAERTLRLSFHLRNFMEINNSSRRENLSKAAIIRIRQESIGYSEVARGVKVDLLLSEKMFPMDNMIDWSFRKLDKE